MSVGVWIKMADVNRFDAKTESKIINALSKIFPGAEKPMSEEKQSAKTFFLEQISQMSVWSKPKQNRQKEF